MRTLCLNLHRSENPSVAENFLSFSPRVHFREPGLVFVDISSTSSLFGGEQSLLKESLQLCNDFFPEASAAIADTPAAAQVFSVQEPVHIVPPSEDLRQINKLPIKALAELEGLVAWQSTREIESIIEFFELLGIQCISEIRHFEIEAFRERWGSTGELLWKRLHGLDQQIISPLQPSESLIEYRYLDYPISLLPFLLHCLEKNIKSLFSRLQGRREFARKVVLHLYCEYSDQCHVIELSPANPNRQHDLFMKLLENKLTHIELDNPIREFEVEVVSVPEKIDQLDFFEPREREADKLEQVMSLFDQAQLTTGYFKPSNAILPEDSWQVTSEFEAFEATDDHYELEALPQSERQAFQVKPAYSRGIVNSPRPTQLLEKPQALSDFEVRRLNFLSHHPVERLEDSWWDTSRGRDYYFAISQKGECLWVYLDRIENRYYIHGYFD